MSTNAATSPGVPVKDPIQNITIWDALNAAILAQQSKSSPVAVGENPFWVVGEIYFIRTVTYHHCGRLVAVYPNELVLTDNAWIADSGRFAEAMKTGEYSEVEPYPDGREVLIGRGAIADACKAVKLARTQK